jgi:hypothetical protein
MCFRLTIGYSAFMLLLIISSCSVPYRNQIPLSSDSFEAPVPWFDSDTGYYLYNTAIDLMNKHYSGITVVKPSGDGIFRVIMMTETGLKIMDIEFLSDSFPVVHYIMEAMNKKILIRTLTRDISLVLMNQLSNKSPEWYQIPDNPAGKLALYTINKEQHHYILQGKMKKPSEAKFAKRNKIKVEAEFFGNSQSVPDSVKLYHNNIDLSITFKRIEE